MVVLHQLMIHSGRLPF